MTKAKDDNRLHRTMKVRIGLWKLLKAGAAIHGIHMQDALEEAVKWWIEKRGGGLPPELMPEDQKPASFTGPIPVRYTNEDFKPD